MAETQAGKGSLPYDHPQSVGAIGATGTTAANALAAEADVVIGVGTRYSDFTTASRTVFADPDVRFVNLNVASFDAHKLVGRGRGGRRPARARAADRGAGRLARPAGAHATARPALAREWDDIVRARRTTSGTRRCRRSPRSSAWSTGSSRPQDVVVCAAGSMPGDLHKLWRTRDRKGYHVEYGFSCMGYEIAGGLGVKMAALDAGRGPRGRRDGRRRLLPDDGAASWSPPSQEGVKLIVVLVQNHGFASIGALSESLGSQRFGTRYRYRTDDRPRRRHAARSTWPPTPPASAPT